MTTHKAYTNLLRLFLTTVVLLSLSFRTTAQRAIVDTSRQLYSYDDMLEDVEQLASAYPYCVSYELRDSSAEGRKLPVVYFGRKDAPHHIMVQAAMHAREYMASLLVMAMLEHYASHFHTSTYRSRQLSHIFSDVCLVIMPMVNPDGIEIAQRGEQGKLSDDVKEWVAHNTRQGTPHDQIKSNARGVDLNRNFFSGFGHARINYYRPNYKFHLGPFPYSEPETQLMYKVARLYQYDCFLNYHTCGNVVFHGSKDAPARVNAAAQRMANLIRSHTGYRLYGAATAPVSGTWADEVELLFHRPSATIEVGTRNPVPLRELPLILRKNLWVWADMALAVSSGQINR